MQLNQHATGKTQEDLETVRYFWSTNNVNCYTKTKGALRKKEDQARENVEFSNDLHESLLQKSGKEFWKCWKSKFPNKNSNILLIDRATDCNMIVDLFAQHFERICMPFNPSRCDDLKKSYRYIRYDYDWSANRYGIYGKQKTKI